MTIDHENLLNSILASLDRIEYINPDDIPNIDLYMDQVTTFMDSRLSSTSRYPGEDKILTKTMINNYAKNDLLPPPVKKKYSKEHILMLIFIYYYKGVLSINDIQTLLKPVSDRFFQQSEGYRLEDVYREAFSLGKQQLEQLKRDVVDKFRMSEASYEDAPEEDRDFLRKFAFICSLSYDVYVKKLIIEKMIDDLAARQSAQKEQREQEEKARRKEAKKKDSTQ